MSVKISKWTGGTHFYADGRGFSMYENGFEHNFSIFGCTTNGTKIRRQYVKKMLKKYETAWRYCYRRALGAVR
jgi:hypothetical protein